MSGMSWVDSFFAWPDGGVWSNLLASMLWTWPALAIHHWLLRKHVTAIVAKNAAPEKEEAA